MLEGKILIEGDFCVLDGLPFRLGSDNTNQIGQILIASVSARHWQITTRLKVAVDASSAFASMDTQLGLLKVELALGKRSEGIEKFDITLNPTHWARVIIMATNNYSTVKHRCTLVAQFNIDEFCGLVGEQIGIWRLHFEDSEGDDEFAKMEKTIAEFNSWFENRISS